jgi:hypothetical protein
MRLAPGQRVEPKAMITLRPRYGMRMMLEDRTSALAALYDNRETVGASASSD